MTEKKRLLEVRKTIKDKKPEFKQQNFGRKMRISDRWRKPKGHQSKMRHRFKGYPIMVSQGWRSPVEVRGLHGKGFEPILVSNLTQIDKIDKKDQAIIVAATVGDKKRLAIIEKAESLNITILNIKTDKFKERIAKTRSDKEKASIEKADKKKKTIEDSLKKAEKKEKDKNKSAEKVETPEEAVEAAQEQKAEEKKAKDDVLIHKE